VWYLGRIDSLEGPATIKKHLESAGTGRCLGGKVSCDEVTAIPVADALEEALAADAIKRTVRLSKSRT